MPLPLQRRGPTRGNKPTRRTKCKERNGAYGMIAVMGRRGPRPGVRQRQNLAYDPAAGKTLSATAYFPPDAAYKLATAVPRMTYDSASGDSLQVSVKLPGDIGAKAWRAAAAANISVSGLLTELVRRMPPSRTGVSANGLLRRLVEDLAVDETDHPIWDRMAQTGSPSVRQLALAFTSTGASAA